MSPDDRNWRFGCGCGANAYIVEAALVYDRDPCPYCSELITSGAVTDPRKDGLVRAELGWCGCGEPEKVDQMMLAYLERCAAKDGAPPDGVSEDAAMLLAYIADELGWAAHGGSIRYAWLTDSGERALANLKNAVGTVGVG